MSVEVRPFGVSCNLKCPYCYQHPMRDAGNLTKPYDLEAMKAALEAEGQPFGLFGGEALLMPLEDMEELIAWGTRRFGSVSIQTNASLMTEAHIELFKRYRVGVGISLDGPDELNDSRWAGDLKKTREATARSHWALRRLIDESKKGNLPVPSLIVTLHRGNASSERLPKLLEWILELDRMGLRHLNVHTLETDHPLVAARMALSDDETLAAMKSIADLMPSLENMTILPFDDIVKVLLGDDRHATCSWNACDPWTTAAVRGVEGNGERSNCGRTNKDGIDWFKADVSGYERQIALYHTPQEWGGCKGCRFFYACKGECPGTAIHGDWRNRSSHCRIWYGLMEHFEELLLRVGQQPLSRSRYLKELEHALLNVWATGRNASVRDTLLWIQNGKIGPQPTYDGKSGHGDHWDGSWARSVGQEHGDSPHGDEHGDSWGTVRGHRVLGVAPVGKGWWKNASA